MEYNDEKKYFPLEKDDADYGDSPSDNIYLLDNEMEEETSKNSSGSMFTDFLRGSLEKKKSN
ncbi:MAG: hypothetical protein WC366_04660 [Bacilli bacterium]|jgi:hypothetical protein